MRHRKAGRQFGRNSSHRLALFRNLVTSLLEHGHIETTEAKAKELRGIADRMITLGKRGDLHAKRQALAYVMSRDVVAKLFSEIAPRSADRNGGYTRVIKTRVRNGDSAPMAIIELVDREGAAAPKPKAKKEAAAVEAAPAVAPATEEKPKKTRKKAEPKAEETPAEEMKAEAATEAAEAAPAPEAEAPAEGEETK
ncbi:MAG TPA: 50S ribosomal protein L17 [Nitrospirota bacterium]|nr:50S ribosomal protein L17 [Nitrospirota bacterium]